MTARERRRRALLLAFPGYYRAARGAELLEVLAECSQARPGWRDALLDDVDLVRSGCAIRFDQAARRGWTDCLAVCSLVLAGLMSIGAAEGLLLLVIGDTGSDGEFRKAAIATAPQAVWPWIVLLGLAGLRRTATALACASAIVPAVADSIFVGQLSGTWLLLGALAAAALVVSPGIERARELLGWPKTFLLLTGVACLALTQILASTSGHVRLPEFVAVLGGEDTCAWVLFGSGAFLLCLAIVVRGCVPTAVHRLVVATLAAPVGVAILTLVHAMAAFEPSIDTAYPHTLGVIVVAGASLASALIGLRLSRPRSEARPGAAPSSLRNSRTSQTADGRVTAAN